MKCSEADLLAGFTGLGLVLPPTPTDKPIEVEIGGDIWWLNQDSRGGFWINGREKRGDEKIEAPVAGSEVAKDAAPKTEGEAALETSTAPETPAGQTAESAKSVELPLEPASTAAATYAPAGATEMAAIFAAIRSLLKETKTGSFAGKLDRVADEFGKNVDELTSALVGAGLKVPEKPREKPVFVEHAGEIFWFNRNAKGELWVNAKASKFANESATAAQSESTGNEGDVKPARGGGGRSRKPASGASESPGPVTEI